MGAWSLPGSRLAVRAFLFPRIDGLSRKRGSDRAEEERNLLWGLTLLLFYFYLWSCSLSSRAVLTVCICAGSLDTRLCCSVLHIPLNLPLFAFKIFISYRSCCFLFSCLPHLLLFPRCFQSPHFLSSPSFPLPLRLSGKVTSYYSFNSLLLQDCKSFILTPVTDGNIYELFYFFFPQANLPPIPSPYPHSPFILKSSLFTLSLPCLHPPPQHFLSFPHCLRHFNGVLIKRVCLKRMAFTAITKAHESVSCVCVYM